MMLYQMDKISTPCAACKHLRRKCTEDCVFAPYFPTTKQENYEAVHKVFGASHVSSLINDLHPLKREFAMNSLAWEARVRVKDPVYGCTATIRRLQSQLNSEEQLAIAKNELASYGTVPTFVPPPPMMYQQMHNNPMKIYEYTPNNGGCLMGQQLHDEAQRFESTQSAQMQQTQETQMQHNEIDRD